MERGRCIHLLVILDQRGGLQHVQVCRRCDRRVHLQVAQVDHHRQQLERNRRTLLLLSLRNTIATFRSFTHDASTFDIAWRSRITATNSLYDASSSNTFGRCFGAFFGFFTGVSALSGSCASSFDSTASSFYKRILPFQTHLRSILLFHLQRHLVFFKRRLRFLQKRRRFSLCDSLHSNPIRSLCARWVRET